MADSGFASSTFVGSSHDDGLSDRARLIALRRTMVQLAHEMSEPMTALAAYLQGSKNLLDRGLQSDLVKVETGTGQALTELARAVDVLRRLRVSASCDAALPEPHGPRSGNSGD